MFQYHISPWSATASLELPAKYNSIKNVKWSQTLFFRLNNWRQMHLRLSKSLTEICHSSANTGCGWGDFGIIAANSKDRSNSVNQIWHSWVNTENCLNNWLLNSSKQTTQCKYYTCLPQDGSHNEWLLGFRCIITSYIWVEVMCAHVRICVQLYSQKFGGLKYILTYIKKRDCDS